MLDDVDKTRLKEDYTAWEEIQERKKQLSTEEKMIKENSAQILDTNATKIGKLFRVIHKKLEDGVDEVDELQELLVQFEN